ncbi:hypothetical protein J6590_020263 [Homalodisca vitripennis]|nr:hypothetical protein J6590_020263 [Homalodisca vitripennis]
MIYGGVKYDPGEIPIPSTEPRAAENSGNSALRSSAINIHSRRAGGEASFLEGRKTNMAAFKVYFVLSFLIFSLPPHKLKAPCSFQRRFRLWVKWDGKRQREGGRNLEGFTLESIAERDGHAPPRVRQFTY